MSTQKKMNDLLNKMSNKKNFLSLDEVYLQEYRGPNRVSHIGKSVITDSNDVALLVTSAIKNADIKSSSKPNNALLYIEAPKSVSLEKIIEINTTAEDKLPCPFKYAVGYSTSDDIKLSIVYLKNTDVQQI